MKNQTITRLSDGSAALALISAWNDSGGGFLTRLLDAHSRLRGWPFELLLGTGSDDTPGAQMIHARYRWPRFAPDADPPDWFDAIADTEMKGVLSGTAPARFNGYRPLPILAAWRESFLAWPFPANPGRRDIIAAYIDSWFSVSCYKPAADLVLGHCPSLILDAGAIFEDFPDAKIVHVVRDPVAGLGDFRRRHPNFDAGDFAARWILVNSTALDAQAARPDAVLITRYEKLRDSREAELTRVLRFLRLPFEPATLTPSWLGTLLPDENLGPFGGVGVISAVHDAEMTAGIPDRDHAQLYAITEQLLEECRQATEIGSQSS